MDFSRNTRRLWRDGATDQHQQLRPIHRRSFLFVTHPDQWSRAGSVVTLSTFVFCMHHRHTLLNGLKSGGTRRDRFFALVFRPTRDRVVTTDANGRRGEAPTSSAGEGLPDRTSTTTATSFSTSCTTGTWRPRPLLSHFGHRHGHPEPAKSVRLTSSWSLLRGTTWSGGTQSYRACHSHFGVRRIIDLSPPRSPFSLSPLWLPPPFIHVTSFAILRRPSRYSSSTTVCRSSLQSVMQVPLSSLMCRIDISQPRSDLACKASKWCGA